GRTSADRGGPPAAGLRGARGPGVDAGLPAGVRVRPAGGRAVRDWRVRRAGGGDGDAEPVGAAPRRALLRGARGVRAGPLGGRLRPAGAEVRLLPLRRG